MEEVHSSLFFLTFQQLSVRSTMESFWTDLGSCSLVDSFMLVHLLSSKSISIGVGKETGVQFKDSALWDTAGFGAVLPSST